MQTSMAWIVTLPELTFVLGAMGVLAAPGPTNRIMATTVVKEGLVPSLLALPASLGAYLAAIGLWGFVLGPMEMAFPAIILLMRVGCVLYVAVTAISLWRQDRRWMEWPIYGNPVLDVFGLTLTSPQPLLLAVGIFPPQAFDNGGQFLAAATSFAAVFLPITLTWIGIGCVASARPTSCRRAAETRSKA
jgi:threonine/homoserine/homoserine lactone efflux protein